MRPGTISFRPVQKCDHPDIPNGVAAVEPGFPRSATIGMGAVGSEHDRLDGRGVGQAVDDAKGNVFKPSLSGSAHAQHMLDGRADAA